MATMLNPNAIQKGSITKDMIDASVLDAKQNITDESLTTISKTIVGAINEVYKGDLKDASITTSKIEDGAVTEGKLASSSVTNEKIADNAVTNEKVNDGAITEPKLDTTLQAKVNNNVKVVEQALTDAQIAIASKNLKLRDDKGNFFADRTSYDAIAALEQKPTDSVFGVGCTGNTFDRSCFENVFGDFCSNNTMGSNNRFNVYGNHCNNNVTGMNCSYNKFELCASDNVLGSEVIACIIRGSHNKISGYFLRCVFECSYVEIKNSLVPGPRTIYAQHIHILSGVQGKSSTERLVINIPDEYLNSSRELIITTKRTDGGPSNPEDLVMYYADEVVDKQNKQDTTLATTSKEVVGAINELFNGGVKDKSIDAGKLTQAVQDTLGKVGMNAKVLPDGTDLLSEDLEEGIYIVDCSKMTNVPSSITKSAYDYALSILIVDREHKRVMLLGPDTNSTKYPTCAYRHLVQKSWNNTPDSIYSKLMSLQLGVDDSVKKRDDNLETTSKEVIGAINELFNGGVKDKSIEAGKLAQAVQDTLGKVGMNVKEVKIGEDLFSLEDGIYSLNGSTYTNYPIGIPFDASSVCILVVTHSNQRATLYGVDGSHSSPILPLVAIGDLTNKRWTGGSFYSFFASDYEVGHKLDQKLDASTGAVKTANLANGAVTLDKIESSVQDTLGKVGMNAKVLPDGTDLLSEDLEEGIYIVDCSKMTNVPSSITKSAYDYALSILIVDREHKRVMLLGPDTNSTKYPTCAYRHLVQKSWNNTPDSIYSKLTSLQLGVTDSVKKQDLLELTDTEVNNIWDNN